MCGHDFWHGPVRAPVDTVDGMEARRSWFSAELVMLGVVVLLGLTIAAPVVLGMLQGADLVHGPDWLWPVAYFGCLGSYILTSVFVDSRTRALPLAVFVVHEALAILSVLLIRETFGIVAVMLVFASALSCYVVPRWATATVVAVNTLVIAVSSLSGGPENAWLNAAFYLAIQAVSVVTISTWIAQERARKRLAEAHAELAAASALLEQSAKDEERLRISRDLHDVIGHQLTALALELEVAAHLAQGSAHEHVLRARGIAKDLLGDVRQAVSRQRADEGSLGEVLRRATDGITRPDVRLTVDDEISAAPELTTLLVRATQEVITNAIRHARGAETLRIEVRRDAGADAVLFCAEDDGWAPRDVVLGNGLRGMRERAERLGGRTRFSRGEDGGFSVRVEVPV